MPTLREFVDSVLAENNLTSDPEQIIRQITDIARQRAVSGCAVIDDREVRDMVINNADLANRIVEEKKRKEEAEAQRRAEAEREKVKAERLKAEQKEAEKREKALEKERKMADGEQLGLFD